VVFDNMTRSDLDPRDHGESQFGYLNRSARPQFETARRRVDEWFSRLCPGLKDGVFQRLRSGDDQEFDSGFWELYLHELFARLGYKITCEPTLPNGRKVDFLLRRDGAAICLEATTAGKSDDQRGANARRNRIFRELNQLQTSVIVTQLVTQPSPGVASSTPSARCRRPKAKYDSGPTPAELTSTAATIHIHFEPRIWLAGRRLMSMSTAVLRMASAIAAATMISLRLRSLKLLHRLAMTSSASMHHP
jgi:hypothetical protein